MNKNRDYIILEYREYGYEIYVVTGDKKIKLNTQNKIIMPNTTFDFLLIDCIFDTHTIPNNANINGNMYFVNTKKITCNVLKIPIIITFPIISKHTSTKNYHLLSFIQYYFKQ